MTHPPIRDLDALRRVLIARREALGIEQADLDLAAGLPPGTVRRYERRLHYLRALDLAAILRVLRLRLALRLRPQHAERLAA